MQRSRPPGRQRRRYHRFLWSGTCFPVNVRRYDYLTLDSLLLPLLSCTLRPLLAAYVHNNPDGHTFNKLLDSSPKAKQTVSNTSFQVAFRATSCCTFRPPCLVPRSHYLLWYVRMHTRNSVRLSNIRFGVAVDVLVKKGALSSGTSNPSHVCLVELLAVACPSQTQTFRARERCAGTGRSSCCFFYCT